MVKLIESFFQVKNHFGEYAVPGRIIFCAPSGALYVTMRLYNKNENDPFQIYEGSNFLNRLFCENIPALESLDVIMPFYHLDLFSSF